MIAPRAALAAALLAGLGACAAPEPIVVSAGSVGPAVPAPSARTPPVAGAAQCKVKIAGIRDLRDSSASLGEIGLRPIQSQDVQAWVRDSLETLAQDPRIALVQDAGEARLELNVEIVKAYVQTLTQAKAANVVLRVRYAAGDEQVYRGRDDSVNWASGVGETNSALGRALGRLNADIRADVLRRCGVATPGKRKRS